MKKFVWLIAALLIVGAVLFVVNQNRAASGFTVEAGTEQEPASEIEIPIESIQPEQIVPSESDTASQENTDPVTEQELQEAWEDLTQQFEESGGLELPEDVF